MHVQDVKIVHFMPGRVRFRIAGLKNNPGLEQELKELFGGVPGVSQIEVKQLTESLLIRYEPSTVKDERSMQALEVAMKTLFPAMDVDELLGWLAAMHK